MPEPLSWEIPRNASEICIVTKTAILRQWAVPTITYEDHIFGYDHSQTKSSFIVGTYRKKYRVTIEEIEGENV